VEVAAVGATTVPTDRAVLDIARYVVSDLDFADAYRIARYSLLDALACAALALGHDECLRMLGPAVAGTVVPAGARVPGTPFEQAPVDAAFDIGCLIRWLDFNDTWLAAEWGHPSDNLGGILAVADHVSRGRAEAGGTPLLMRDVLTAMIKAYEIQGVLSLANSFNRSGFDHVVLVRVATAATATWLMGGDERSVAAAVANAWLDGGSLRAYRHAPNVTWRKSWAAPDATSRGVRLAQLVLRGATGCPTPLTAPGWGVSDVMLAGREIVTPQPYGSYTMTNVVWKAAYPGEMHAQTAVEAALELHDAVCHRLDDVVAVVIRTHESAVRIIDKQGPLTNPADRDHCLQYMVAVALIHGRLTSADYEDAVAADPRIDALRARMTVTEDPSFSRDYLAEDKRSIANALEVSFRDGSSVGPVTVAYPIGHPRRRAEGVGAVQRKFEAALKQMYPAGRCEEILAITGEQARLERTPVHDFMAMLSTSGEGGIKDTGLQKAANWRRGEGER
jgi:2-methylcitrate dehydratase